MNVDFVALGGTAWTVGGAMIVACMRSLPEIVSLLIGLFRWCYENWGGGFPGNKKRYICERCPESYSSSRMQCLRTFTPTGPELPLVEANRRSYKSH